MNVTNKRIIKEVQGSDGWHKHRATHFNASDAPAMLGISSYTTRGELLRQKATGDTPAIDTATQKRFDDGHKFEAIAREWAEEIIGEQLYPVTLAADVDGLPLGASLDGLTMLEEIAFEHKTLNQKLAHDLDQGVIPAEYLPQMEQQALISGALKVLFMASNGDKETMRFAWYEPTPAERKQLLAGWRQFAEDLTNYQPAEPVVEVVGKRPDNLPALHIEVSGMVKASNLSAFKEHALAVVDGIKTELATDEEFADAEETAKWIKTVEAKLKAAKDHAQAQMESVDDLFRTIDNIGEQFRQKRLTLESNVKTRKQAIRDEILRNGNNAYADHLGALNKSLGHDLLIIATGTAPKADFAGAMKGKKKLSALRDAVDQELARVKIASNEIVEKVRGNLKTLEGLIKDDQRFLVSDWRDLVFKDADAVEAIVTQRIAKHEKDEQEKRERIRQEEADRLREAQEESRRIQAAQQSATEAPRPAIDTATPRPVATAKGPATLREDLNDWQIKHEIAMGPYRELLRILEKHHINQEAA